MDRVRGRITVRGLSADDDRSAQIEGALRGVKLYSARGYIGADMVRRALIAP